MPTSARVRPRATSTSRRAAPASEVGLQEAAELLRALASPHRLAIVRELEVEPRCVHELVEALGVSQPLVSQHLRVLRASHLVRAERRGREIAYSLSDGHVAHIAHDAVVHATERELHR